MGTQILTMFPSVRMTLEKFLVTVAPMKKRYYSISSSPSAIGSKGTISGTVATITVGLVTGTETTIDPSPSSSFVRDNTRLNDPNNNNKEFRGVSSGYLSDVRPGQLVE